MLPTYQIEIYLRLVKPGLHDIVWELRNIIASAAPNATEVMHSRGMSYYHAERGGTVSAGICQIVIREDHIRLAFIHGAFLPDSKGLFEGTSRYKKYIRIYSYEEAPWDDLKELIAASSRFDPRALSLQ